MNVRVDWRASCSLVGTVVKWLAVAMVFPLALAVFYGEGVVTFLASMALAVGIGWSLERLDDDPDLGAREGFLMVALTWLVVSFVGASPYVIAGQGTVGQPVNALFESMSGFTTTGATVMGSIGFERHSRALMMWRQQTQWLGGMGIVVLAVAILPELSVGGAQLMDAEAPGPGIQKLTPRIAETARALWGIYFAITVLEMVLLYSLHLADLAPNMTLYNAVAHALTTMPTGGFSPAARSIEAFSAAVQWLIIPFMVAAGTNFALFWHLLNGDFDTFREDTEFRFYASVLAVFSGLVAILLFTGGTPELTAVGPLSGNAEKALRHAVFQVVSLVTTTGYASMDFAQWGTPAQYVLFVMLFVGGSAGSTGGAVKIVRWLVVLKSLKRELFTTVHPEAVRPVRLGDRALDERAVRGIYAFTLLYLVIFFVAAMLVYFDAARTGLDLVALDAMSAVAATLGNVGPGFGIVGPMESYLRFPRTSKLFMVFLMWIGRLEILPVLVLLTPAYWQS
ncbi:TrkH family potassium uptake protein [Halorussus aquaticus]|uniref:TrkH family potassium uptake protein n=1 Tax=Halorussus aquaticus TaxID=2953748 RepID=A0ABD5Q590_9EURY|nr:TrkH family potassium uptake protein [Halorussus aquaticus]